MDHIMETITEHLHDSISIVVIMLSIGLIVAIVILFQNSLHTKEVNIKRRSNRLGVNRKRSSSIAKRIKVDNPDAMLGDAIRRFNENNEALKRHVTRRR